MIPKMNTRNFAMFIGAAVLVVLMVDGALCQNTAHVPHVPRPSRYGPSPPGFNGHPQRLTPPQRVVEHKRIADALRANGIEVTHLGNDRYATNGHNNTRARNALDVNDIHRLAITTELTSSFSPVLSFVGNVLSKVRGHVCHAHTGGLVNDCRHMQRNITHERVAYILPPITLICKILLDFAL